MLSKLTLICFLFLSFAVAAGAQEGVILEPKKAPQIIPLHDLNCSDYRFDEGKMLSKDHLLYACYSDFLTEGKDESICGQFSELEKEWTIPPSLESRTNDCYFGFALAKNDYKICDSIVIRDALLIEDVLNRDKCYMGVALVSHNPELCTLLRKPHKEHSWLAQNSCFSSMGPVLHSTWILWFLSQVGLYALIALVVFISVAVFFVTSDYRKDLVIFSLLVAFLEFASIFIFNDGIDTSILQVLVLLPAASLFLSAFAIKKFDSLLQKEDRKLPIFATTLLIGFLHGFLAPIQPSFKVFGFEAIAFGGVFIMSFVNAALFLVAYLMFYFWIMRKVQKQKSPSL